MSTGLLIKPGVAFVWAPAMARILEAVRALNLAYPVTITSGSDGLHSGPADPHHTGDALDFRTHDLAAADVNALRIRLAGTLGPKFYVLHESPGTANEHLHVQRRKGTQYTVRDYVES